MSPIDTASLVVALSDLAVVRLVRDAIRTADIHSGKGQPVSGLGPAPNPDFERRFHVHPQPEYEPRPHIHLAPKVEPRTIVYEVRLQPRLEQQFNNVGPAPEVPVVKTVCPIEQPFPPVWQQVPPLPPVNHGPPRRVVKVSLLQPDIRHKGLVIDTHI